MSAFWDAGCEDESGYGKTQKHKGANREGSKNDRNISSDRWHTFFALFLPETDNKTPHKWCKREENNLTLFIPCCLFSTDQSAALRCALHAEEMLLVEGFNAVTLLPFQYTLCTLRKQYSFRLAVHSIHPIKSAPLTIVFHIPGPEKHKARAHIK